MKSPALSRAIKKFATAAIGLQKNREKDSIASRHTYELKQFFQMQARLVIFRMGFMQEYMPDTLNADTSLNRAPISVDDRAMKRWEEIWKDVEAKTTDDLQKIILAIEQEAFKKGEEQLKSQLGRRLADKDNKDFSFKLSNPRAVKWFEKNGGSVDYIKDIQDTTAESLKRLIKTGLDEGWSYSQTAREIRKLYDGPITKTRAQLIAVTESAKAYEAGNHVFAKSIEGDGIEMEKMWMTSHDDRVSDECAYNEDAGWIDIDDSFPSGDIEPPRFPGCRCYTIYREVRK